MKALINLLIIILFTAGMHAQNLGINTTTPLAPLHVQANNNITAILENQSPLELSLQNGLYFAYGIQSPNTYKYAGAIKTIGTSPSSARLGFFTNTTLTPAGLAERMTIDHSGRVGIGTTYPEWGLDVSMWTRLSGPVGIQTPPSGSYALSVAGSVWMANNARIDGILNPNNPLAIGNNTSIEGSLTVNNGKGIVRSTNSTQMKIKRRSASFSASNFGAGQTIASGTLSFGEDFTSVTVVVGQVYNGTGDYAKILLVPYNVNEIQNTCEFLLTNTSNSTITFSASWEIVFIGD